MGEGQPLRRSLGSSSTILVPSVNLLVTSHGSVWSKKGGAQAHGKFYVGGILRVAYAINGLIVSEMAKAGR